MNLEYKFKDKVVVPYFSLYKLLETVQAIKSKNLCKKVKTLTKSSTHIIQNHETNKWNKVSLVDFKVLINKLVWSGNNQ